MSRLEICTKCRIQIPKGNTYVIDDVNDVICNLCYITSQNAQNKSEENDG